MPYFNKILITLLIFSLLLNCNSCSQYQEKKIFTPVTDITSTQPEVNGKNVIVTDMATGRVLYDKESDEKVPMASTTKIMTALIIIENCNINDHTTVSKKAALIQGSTMNLAEGETISIHDLLYGLMLNSGNDAAVTLAEYYSGSEKAFAKVMNEKALELGAINTNFTSPHGLDDPDHYTTAKDLALIASEAYKHELFRNIVNTAEIKLYGHYLKNTNPVLDMDGINGMKTGYTHKAGKCIVLSGKDQNVGFFAVILGCDSSEDRIKDCILLSDYVFDNYKTYDILNRTDIMDSIKVSKGVYDRVICKPQYNLKLTLTNAEYETLEIKYTSFYEESISAPVNELYPAGMIEIYAEDKKLWELNAVFGYSIKKKDLKDFIFEILINWTYMIKNDILRW